MSEVLGWTTALLVALYVGQAALLRLGLRHARIPQTSAQPTVSVLIAARNEEDHLGACLNSLVRVDYPKDRLEILVLDDASEDRTGEIARDYAHRYPFLHAIHLSDRVPGLSGKASALCQGLDRATGEIVLITDADCIVPPTWVRAYVSYYTPDVGIVGGFTLLDRLAEKAPLFAKVQALDWIYLLTVGAGAAGLGRPVSVLGNNFSFRRAAYDVVGGYRKLGFSIIEDFALMRAVVARTPWRVCFPIDHGTTVYSRPMPTWKEFYHQRKRWAAGGKEVSVFAKGLMATSFLTHLLLPATLPFPSLLPLTLIGFAAVLAADGALLWISARRLNRLDLLRYLFPFELFYFFYTTAFAPVVLLRTTVEWKGVRYEWRTANRIGKIQENPEKQPGRVADDT